MLKPTVKVDLENGILIAEFWDCLRLDAGAVQDLRSKYESHLRTGGRPELVIDLLGVGFAGSASLGHFVALHRIARPKNGRLIFCNVDPQVLEVFKVSKLEPLFVFATDRSAALEVANGSGAAGPERSPTPTAPAGTGVEEKVPAPSVRKPGGNGLLHSSRRKKLS